MKIKIFKTKNNALILPIIFAIISMIFNITKPVEATEVAELLIEASTQKYPTQQRTLNVDGVEIFYREAGPVNAPTIVLLQGLSSVTDNFLNIIPQLSNRFHVLAPDYPGYGKSANPETDGFETSADHLAYVMSRFINKKGLSQYGLLVEHKSSPIAVRMTLQNPQQVQFLITRNGDKYEDHLAEISASIRDYWNQRTPQESKFSNGLNSPTAWGLTSPRFTASHYIF